ncbi:hypothetical protein PVAND_013163 [Polypedilum vanderplanki]|uniref:Small ribosomal subunit protein mS39 n=1 Tax=Polypedilum vanderplanki TaxID=319348 RepID=A0A9J6CPL4_POLVA|nr:hypothetical protein PVAND_013163 [Polypedilum vanderplanki]
MQHLKRSINSFTFLKRSKTWSYQRFCATSSESNEKIEIPNYIPRSPTSILRALSQTVGFDRTAAHFKYHDDPYLIPLSNIGKRSFALAQESGRKSAKWIRQQHSNLFQHKEADPPIEAFMPTKIYTAESEVNTSDLESLIEHSQVTDAILVYTLLKNKNIEIPSNLQLSFLELICYHNCEEPLDEDLIEERWFRQSERLKERPRKTWKDNDLAEQLYHEIEPKDSKAHSCIIRGMCKYYQAEKAWAIFQNCLSNNIQLDVHAFNSILNVVMLIKESAELRWQLILELLTHMKNQQISPNLGTMNACLNTISNMGVKNAKDYATSILTEFKKIGIEPSLSSWYYVLRTFCNNRGPVSHVLVDIMAEIEGKEFEIRDIKDTFFFVTAMDVCKNHLFDLNLAKRVDALLHHGENFNLIGDSFKESTYYRHYFSLLVQTEPIEVFMQEYYDQLVPHVYIPEPMVMEEILKGVEVSGQIEHIPLLWSHMICFDQIYRENLLNAIVRIMIQNKPDISIKSQEKLPEQFGAIAYDIWSKIEEKNELRSKPMIWSGKLLGDILKLLCRINDMEKATKIMDKLANDQQKILGEPDFTAMQDFVKLCILKKQPSKALQCLQYCSSIGFNETRDLAKLICHGFTLDENHMKKLAYFVGSDVIEEVEREKQTALSENLKQ